MVTIVGAVYQTVVTNGVAFQRKIEERQQQEKRVEQAVRAEEMRSPKREARDPVDVSGASSANAPSKDGSAAAQPTMDHQNAQGTSSPQPAPAPLGQTVDTVA